MKTLNPKQIENKDRKWYLVDADGQNLWRLATKLAVILRWKDRVDFAPHVDNWSYIVVTNCEKIAVTWNKEEDKLYRTHSQFMGWLKEVSVKTMREKNPSEIIKLAVKWMLPKTRHRENMLARLKLCVWAEHTYEAQKPETITL